MTPRQRVQIRRAVKARDPDPSEEMGELNIVPFLDIVVNLMLFLLATSAAVLATAETNVESPELCRGAHCARRAESMQLSVTLADGGIVVASRSGRLGAGCDEGSVRSGSTLAVPSGGDYDFEALVACLGRVHERYPEEREVILGADPGVRYGAIIGAIDAIRPSFPIVRLSAGVR